MLGRGRFLSLPVLVYGKDVSDEVKKSRRWLWLAVLCLFLGVGALYGSNYLRNNTEIVLDTGIVTNGRNRCVAVDEESNKSYVGTHDGTLKAFRDGEEIWSAVPVSGAYCELVLNADKTKIYAGNEGQQVYVYDAQSGSLLLQIPVGRNVVGIAVNSDESRIAVATNTGRNKSNLLIYSAEGEELYNTQFGSTVFRSVEYGANDILLVGNKRGEVTHMSEDGEKIDTYKANYDIIQMKMNNGICWVLSLDGTYHALDGQMNCIRKGKINNTINANLKSIGVDTNGAYVFVGTEQGYVFVNNDQDAHVYTADFGSQITDTFTGSQGIYFTSIENFVKVLYTNRLENTDQIKTWSMILNIAMYVLFALFVVFGILGLSKLRNVVAKFLKALWKYKMAYIMLLPTFIILFFFTYRGIFMGLIRAFTNWSSRNYFLADIDFVGLDNFAAIIENGYFLIGIKNLALIVVTNILKTITVPVAIAWMIWAMKGHKRKYVHRFLCVLPIVIPGVVNIMVWQRIYDPTVGLINNLLDAWGLENLQRVWLGDSSLAIWAVLFVGFPFVMALPMLVYYGALSNIGGEVIESALIDGAGKWKVFWIIQLPLIKPQIKLLVMLSFIGSMQDFYTIFILTSGGPGTSTYVPALELYMNVSQFGNYGYASAMGIVLMICTLVPVLISQTISRRKGD